MNRIEPTIDSAVTSTVSVSTPTRSAARQKYDAHLSALQAASAELYDTIVATESAATLEAYKTLHNSIIGRAACGLSIMCHDMTYYHEVRANLVKTASARALVAFDEMRVLNAENMKMLKALPATDLDDYSPHNGWIGLVILCLIGWGLYKFFTWFAAL